MAVTVREDVSPYATAFSVSRNLVRKSDGSLWCCYVVHNAITDRDEIHCSYSTDDGATWTAETVIGSAGNDYGYIGLAVDSAGNLHLVYFHYSDIGPTKTLEYKKRTSVGWGAAAVIDTNFYLWYGISIAIDSSDNLHVAWGLLPGWLRYREKIGDSWQATEELTIASAGVPSIAIDGSDDVHVAFAVLGGEGVPIGIHYFKKTAGVWGAEQEITPSHYQDEPSMAIDSSGNVHVAWWGTPGGIYYTMWDAAIEAWWSPQYLGDGQYPSVAVDDDDLVQIFLCYENLLVRLWKTDIGWDYEVVTCTDLTYYASAIWATWPMVGAVRTNVLDGFSVVWTRGSSYNLLYYGNLVPVGVPYQINKAYALAREGL